MKRVALQIEHKFKNRLVATHLIEGEGRLATIGASKTADVRLLGDDVSDLHAAFEHTEQGWTLADLGSAAGTWVNKKPVVESEISGATIIHIGNHQLKAVPTVLDRDLFLESTPANGRFTYHQVVVFHKGLVEKSLLLPSGAPFEHHLKGSSETLPAPGSDEWVDHEYGAWKVRQRLTKSDLVLESGLTEGLDLQRSAPMVAALALFGVIFSVMVLLPSRPADELKTLTPEMQNQYTRMILDGKRVRSKKLIAEKLRKNINGQSQQGIAKNTPGGDSGAKKEGGAKATPGARVVTNIKSSGLGALIGKISQRAGKNALLVQSAGVSPENRSSGTALSLGGGSALDKIGRGTGGTGNGTQKIAGLGTAGKGGGSLGYQGSGALSLGNVGNADVGVLEEETEIDGGLDKEAIARVIRSQLGQIRYCYERQLAASPDLYGKVMIKFTIGAAGSVVAQAIGTTSLNNAMVEGCILRRVAGWKFPQPKGGTSVLVTYPFLFKSTR